jgi:hypothetical protein
MDVEEQLRNLSLSDFSSSDRSTYEVALPLEGAASLLNATVQLCAAQGGGSSCTAVLWSVPQAALPLDARTAVDSQLSTSADTSLLSWLARQSVTLEIGSSSSSSSTPTRYVWRWSAVEHAERGIAGSVLLALRIAALVGGVARTISSLVPSDGNALARVQLEQMGGSGAVLRLDLRGVAAQTMSHVTLRIAWHWCARRRAARLRLSSSCAALDRLFGVSLAALLGNGVELPRSADDALRQCSDAQRRQFYSLFVYTAAAAPVCDVLDRMPRVVGLEMTVTAPDAILLICHRRFGICLKIHDDARVSLTGWCMCIYIYISACISACIPPLSPQIFVKIFPRCDCQRRFWHRACDNHKASTMVFSTRGGFVQRLAIGCLC